MVESVEELRRQLQAKAKTIEQVIHGSHPSAEICDLKCEYICQATNECPFREFRQILELDDVVGVVEAWQQRQNQQLQDKLVDFYDKLVHFPATHDSDFNDKFVHLCTTFERIFLSEGSFSQKESSGSGETQQKQGDKMKNAEI